MINTKQLFKVYNFSIWKKNKFQMFLSIIAIAISVAILLSIELMLSLNNTYINNNAVNSNDGDININLLQGSLTNNQFKELNTLKAKGYINYTTIYKIQNNLALSGVSGTIFLKFVDPSSYPIADSSYNYRTKLKNNCAVISSQVANKFNLRKGSIISLQIKGKERNLKLKISDIVNSNVSDEGIVGVITINKNLINKEEGALTSNVLIKLNDKYKLEDVQNKISKVFKNDCEINTYKDVIEHNKQTLDSENKVLNILEIIVILISGVSIATTVILLNLKRKKDYIILNIYGMSEDLLKKLTLYETFIISTLGSIIGIIISFIIIGITQKSIVGKLNLISIISASGFKIIETILFIIAETIIFTLFAIEISKKVNPTDILRERKIGIEFKRNLSSPFLKTCVLIIVSFALYIRSLSMSCTYVFLIILFILIILAVNYFIINLVVKVKGNKNKYILLSIRNLKRQKLKFAMECTALTIVMILCGVIANLCYGVIPSIMNQYVINNNGYNFIIRSAYKDENEIKEVLKQDKLEGVKRAVATAKILSDNNRSFEDILKDINISGGMGREYIDTFSNLSAYGIDLSKNVMKYEVVEGRGLNGSDKNSNSVVLGNEFSGMGINVNDEIKFKVGNKILKLRVIGIMKKNIITGGKNLYMSLKVMKDNNLLNDEESSLEYLVKEPLKDKKNFIFYLSKQLKHAEVFSISEELNQLKDYLQKLVFAVVVICFVSIFAAMCLISNILIVINYERIKEFLILKVVGAKNRDIRKIVILEGIIVGFISGVLAELMEEVISSFIMSKVLYFNYKPNIIIIFSMILITLIISISSALFVTQNMKIEEHSDVFRIE
ncbi:ABC transporter permease [Clostridium felsineum]|uniref:Uncharacterized protein n=1 Tax=Clostridium felsineum TaxID=36839 RepID=A0A1S8KYE0_9CLOT|nr:FtsX-like permease family protein [Clostridium felsineum]URZ09749.1 hypothetical protein CROST_004420 [Clostridium felsineum]